MVLGASEYNDMAEKKDWPALCDANVKFTHPDLARLLCVWRRAAKGSGLPRESDMTARLLRPFLSDIVIYERVVSRKSEQRWRVRLMGTSFAQIMGDLNHKFLDKAVHPTLLPRWHASLDATLGERAPLRFLAQAVTSGMRFLVGEYFSAPLIAADGSASLVLAAGRFTGGRAWPDVEAEARQALRLG